jgi:hypothetical protein
VGGAGTFTAGRGSGERKPAQAHQIESAKADVASFFGVQSNHRIPAGSFWRQTTPTGQKGSAGGLGKKTDAELAANVLRRENVWAGISRFSHACFRRYDPQNHPLDFLKTRFLLSFPSVGQELGQFCL